MPKIKCSGCEAVLNVPDNMPGKTIQCPKCATKFKLPGQRGAAGSGKKQPAAESDVMSTLAKIDLNRLESADEGDDICPYCAAERDPEDPVCRNCGMNVETGEMDPQEKRKRMRKGPDPDLFYATVWSDAWAFTLEHKPLIAFTGTFWSLFATLNVMCYYLWYDYCQRGPTQAFWLALTVITGLGIPGWFLFLGLKVIQAAMLREEIRTDRIHFDFFLAVTAGVRTVFWPLIVLGPITPVLACLLPLLIGTVGETTTMILSGVIWLALPLFLLPIAMVHMASRYTYKAWIGWELMKIFVRVVPATLYFLIVIVLMLLPVAAVAALICVPLGAINPFLSERFEGSENIPGFTGNIALSLMKLADLGEDRNSIYYAGIKGPLNLLGAYLAMAPISYVAAVPAVFLMRAFGLYGYYNQIALEPVNQIRPGTPATFWVRYLAHTIDCLFFPLASLLVVSNKKALIFQWLVNGAGLFVYFSLPDLLPIYAGIWALSSSWMYWSVQESSELNATLGKDAFGLMVVTDDDKTLSMGEASYKWLLRILFYIPLGIPYLWAVFNPEKRTLHDLATRTRVVWKGDK